MKIYKINYCFYGVVFVAFLLSFIACDTTMTSSFEKYVKKQEKIYPPNVDTAIVRPGLNKLTLILIRPVDPRVTRTEVYWHNGQDSIGAPFQNNQDTLKLHIKNIEEGDYTFQVYTYDDKNDQSIVKPVIAKVFGQDYINSLLSRPINHVKLQIGGNTFIEWGSTSPDMLGTVVKYTDTLGNPVTLFVPPDSSSTELDDFKTTTSITYQTLFRPDSTVIDTFYSNTATANIDQIVLQNSNYPIQHAQWDGKRYGDPAHWMTNDAARNLPGGYGGFDGLHGQGYLALATNNKAPAFNNGKLYQTIGLPAGSYELKIKFGHQYGGNRIFDQAYLVVAAGDSLPNVEDIDNDALGYSKLSNGTVDFTLIKGGNITYGFVATFTQNGNYFRCSDVSLGIK